MRPTQHPSNNRVLGAPPGWNQGGELPCSALAITDATQGGMPCVVSFWRPDAAELALLNAGGLVALSIVGGTMPPASVFATNEETL
ncbi:hypothetical protein J7E70_02105 [Variovorax paradoxus]|nr:hypothetical protein [Variovorax paradoxus]MBT2299247.1 hypothetical protein [Variovorax paradoxus]